jgi:PAS domain S-box-containing protein
MLSWNNFKKQPPVKNTVFPLVFFISFVYKGHSMRVHYDMKYELTDQDIRFFFSAMVEGGAKVDAAGNFLYVGDTYAKMLGHVPGDLLGRPWIDTICESERAHAQEACLQAKSGKKILFETKNVRKDGTSFSSKLTLAPLPEKDIEKCGCYCLVQDVDHEYQLKRNKEWYRGLYLKTPMMLHSVDKKGRLLNVSNFWLLKLGYERQEVLHRPLTDFMTNESKERFHLALDHLMNEGCIRVYYQLIKKDGQLLDVELSSVGEMDANGNFLTFSSTVY